MKLEEFDSCKEAVLNAPDVVKPVKGCPKVIVTCFAHDLVDYAAANYDGKIISHFHYTNGRLPLYEIQTDDKSLGLIMTLVGAPAAVCQYEELFAMGVEHILVFGTCGVLDKNLEDCSIIIPDEAVREEGTSYHYEPGSDRIAVNVDMRDQMIAFFDEQGVSSTVGTVWTTDGVYRETREKVARRKKEGCICVDMECSAFAALAKFRGKTVSQFFYSADNLDSDIWDKRSLSNHSEPHKKRNIVDLAIRLGQRLSIVKEINKE